MDYLVLKHWHVACVAVSFSLFLLRFLRYVSQRRHVPRWLKCVPHVVDSMLLLSALGMAYLAGFTPSNSPWLLAKIIALLFYIVFGVLAMRGCASVRWWYFAAACLCFAYLVMVALSKSPWVGL